MRMFKASSFHLPALALALLVSQSLFYPTGASILRERILRRQTSSSESEQESTTQANKDNNQQGQASSTTELPPRLYPDLPRAPVGVFGQPDQRLYPQHHGPTPFIPFANQLNPNRLDVPRPMQPVQRPMNPSERLQSQSFTNGLGRRLLSMVGIEPSGSNDSDTSNTSNSDQKNNRASMEETMRALQNSTVLHQLNRGVHSIYGSLSKMYNQTVQQQLGLLQDRFKKEAENSTNPWQQRMAQQVPQFFRMMATRVDEAQEGLNRLWNQVTQAGNASQAQGASGSQQQQPDVQTRTIFDSFLGNHDGLVPYNDAGHMQDVHPGNFFNQIGRSFGFNNDPMGGDRQDSMPASGGRDLASQMREFWMSQVQPQIGMLRGQISRVWRDLTSSGALAPFMVNRNTVNSAPGSQQANGETANEKSTDFVDSVLRGLDMGGQDFALVEPKTDQQQRQQQQPDGRSSVGIQMQNRLIAMQRDLNQLWNGLTQSLQGAVSNVRSTLNPQARLTPVNAGSPADKEIDPAENEIDGTIKDLSKLQKDADVVHDVVQRQQQAQQRPGFGDRFRNFFTDFELNVDQLPNRFGDSVSRFGNAVNDFWHQIPRRWDNFVQNVRPEQPNMVNARIKATNETQTKPAQSATS